jgi:hypothetical protein
MFSCMMRTAGPTFKPEDQAVAQIGQPIRRYTVIPLEEPVAPTAESVMPPPPNKAPNDPAPVPKPEPKPAK